MQDRRLRIASGNEAMTCRGENAYRFTAIMFGNEQVLGCGLGQRKYLAIQVFATAGG